MNPMEKAARNLVRAVARKFMNDVDLTAVSHKSIDRLNMKLHYRILRAEEEAGIEIPTELWPYVTARLALPPPGVMFPPEEYEVVLNCPVPLSVQTDT